MAFHSAVFVVFALLVFSVAAVAGHRWRSLFLVGASYLFYSFSYPPWLLILVACTVADFHLARWIDRKDSAASRRLALAASVVLNLGLLGFYKYAGFLAASINGATGTELLPVVEVELPLGISFFVFESLSYCIDVYRRRMRAIDRLSDYALFISFFPHLIAGPIVRARDFLPQIRDHRPLDPARTVAGLELIAIGMVKKVVVADNLSPIVDSIFANPAGVNGIAAWTGAVFFAIQIYCDFSGYTDIARGLARMLGFELCRNFHWPYFSTSIRDFWRRWHMSLSSWLRDYLYIPLGGNRNGTARTLAAVVVTWFLGGLWHGAAWHFVAWGLFHGALVSIGALVYARGGAVVWDRLPAILRTGVTFALVCMGWVLFRAETMADAVTLLGAMLTPWQGFHPADYRNLDSLLRYGALPLLAAFHLLAWRVYGDDDGRPVLLALPYPARVAVLAVVPVTVAALAGKQQSFIYFQF